ncbi:MAG: hypothetical protein PVG16_02875 [Chromatiales bacterium]
MIRKTARTIRRKFPFHGSFVCPLLIAEVNTRIKKPDQLSINQLTGGLQDTPGSFLADAVA